MTLSSFDPRLIKKYDAAGPRYTSYPTAPSFHDGFGPKEFAENERLESREAPKDLSLYFHLPFCRRVCYVCACNVTFTNDRESGTGYSNLIAREMDLVRKDISGSPKVRQLHWCGVTPTFSSP